MKNVSLYTEGLEMSPQWLRVASTKKNPESALIFNIKDGVKDDESQSVLVDGRV